MLLSCKENLTETQIKFDVLQNDSSGGYFLVGAIIDGVVYGDITLTNF